MASELMSGGKRGYTLDTNLADLLPALSQELASYLNDVWVKIIDDDKNNGYYSRVEEIQKIARTPEPGVAIIRLWGNRGQTVRTLLTRLQMLTAVHGGGAFDSLQLVLGRKFKAVRWVDDRYATVYVPENSQATTVEVVPCAIGFPFPKFEWFRDGQLMPDSSFSINIMKCKCELAHKYTCRAWNEIEDGRSFSDSYRKDNKQYWSELTSEPIDLTEFLSKEEHPCERCRAQELEKIREIMAGTRVNELSKDGVFNLGASTSQDGELLYAADKVALLIANCEYRHLPQLQTPRVDAEMLAQALQEMDFKTVTLADLTLSEMQFIIEEYKKLLGNDVYAVLYFAGHGFEVNGQCYLLPVDAPLEAHTPDCCISMDWVMASWGEVSPALHLILLDVCRKGVPKDNVPLFIDVAETYRRKYRANRNTVYGYSTSGGVGAYEVQGEMNGVFMTYLKEHIALKMPVVDVLQKVFVDIEGDKRVRNVQIPELRTSLTKPRGLFDPLVYHGHTISFDHHSVHWRIMHELPNPVYVPFESLQLRVTIWFEHCGTYTNMAYVHSSVGPINEDHAEDPATKAKIEKHLAYLMFPEGLEMIHERILEEDEEGITMCWMVTNLQRSNGPLECTVNLCEGRDDKRKVVETKTAPIGHVLITRIDSLKKKRINDLPAQT